MHPPYPPSEFIKDVTFDWTTHDRRAPGSDNWPVTWADDGHQYTVWGDGGGFGGTNKDGRVSLGIARIEGPADNYRGINVWGGKNAENPAQFTGKSHGIIAIDGKLYLWRSGDKSGKTSYKFQELYVSEDHGATWEFTGVKFTPDSFPGRDIGFFLPTFLQFGKDYRDSRDDSVYMYATEMKTDRWEVHKPGEIALMKVHKEEITNLKRYEYFAGLQNGLPVWTKNISKRRPVFSDPENGIMRIGVTYNSGLKRYLLTVEHSEISAGNMGIFDAPQPWGPWTTVYFKYAWGSPHIEANTFFWNFSNKWQSDDGLDFVLVFTGKETNDSWNTIKGSFILF
ncbi:MAG: DUF4185 domain-containing protein [Calditrichia bacterium]